MLVLGEVGALGDAEDVIVFNGGTLRYTSASVSDDISGRMALGVNSSASSEIAYRIDTGGQDVVFSSFIGAIGYAIGANIGGSDFYKLGNGSLVLDVEQNEVYDDLSDPIQSMRWRFVL